MKLRAQARCPAQDAPRKTVRRVELPHRAKLAQQFGPKVAHLPVYTGDALAAALARRNAQAAALDGAVLLRDENAPADVVAHEVVHALQQPRRDHGPDAIVPRLQAATTEPAHSGAENEAHVFAANDTGAGETGHAALPDAPLHSMAPGVAALLRSGPAETNRTAPPASPAREEPAADSAPASRESAREEAAPAQSDEGFEPAPTFAPAEPPATALDPAEEATREAEKAEAEAALQQAESPSAVMDAYAGMAPSVKALNTGQLGDRVGQTNAAETARMAEDTPAVSARLGGEDSALPSPDPIRTPAENAEAPPPEAAAPVIDVPDGPDQPELRPDPTVGQAVARRFAHGADPEGIEDQIGNVDTDNPGVETQIEDRADVPLEGATDPARMDEEAHSRAREAAARRSEATQAVVEGPGPEAVAPREIEAEAEPLSVEPREIAEVETPEGAEQLNGLELPGEVVASFDSQNGESMAASAQSARGDIATAEEERDTAHDAAVSEAEAQRDASAEEADGAQRDEIVSRREAVQAERQATVDAQQAAVEDAESRADIERERQHAEADTRVEADRERIDACYDEAERDAESEVQDGERRAEREQEQAERESENDSWWDRATSWIQEAFEALTQAISDIFDAVRSAVSTIIDLAVDAVTAIIEVAAAALQALVTAFGEFLTLLVDELLGEIFPELAAALTEFINTAVALANAAIDVIAERLTAAVRAIGAALNSAINSLLDVLQGAINGALAIMAAAISGDWGAVLRMVLESVLSLLGIDPEEFYAMLANAQDAIGLIVNDPGAFLANLLDAVTGGIGQFGSNFGDHLRAGLIGWLTGALGDIEMPEEWNLAGLLDIARQILGLTWDFMRERAARIIGEENVARLEAAFDWIMTLVTEGWAGLWARIQGELESLKDMVMTGIRDFLLEKIVIASITWLASLFNPVGAIVKLVMTIWNIFQFVSNQLQRLFGIARAVVEGIANIARGVLGPAMDRVEQVLGDLVPVVIDLLMSLLGVTGVARRVRGIIEDVREAIANAVDRMIDRVIGTLLGRNRRGRGADGAEGDGDGSAATDGRIGEALRVDVEDGPDHTLSVDRTGEGGATVMLRSDPIPLDRWLTTLSERARRMRDEDKQRRTNELIERAQQQLASLDDAADRAAAIAPSERQQSGSAGSNITAMERNLVPILEEIFNTVGSSDLLSMYRIELDSLHPDAGRVVSVALGREAERYIRMPDWAAIRSDMESVLPLFVQPLLTGNAFSEAARQLIRDRRSSYSLPEDAGFEMPTASADDLLRVLAGEVRAGADDDYLELHRQLVNAAIHNRDIGSVPASATDGAILEALRTLANRGNTEVDPELRQHFTGSRIIASLLTIARGGSVGTINEARLEELWMVQANVEHIKTGFRNAAPGNHEWIPSNYILRVIQRAGEVGRTPQERAEEAALWINVQHAWRTRTPSLIYEPDYSSRTIGGATVLQGHSGAIYAMTSGARVTPQTERQNIWHNRLREIYDRTSFTGDSVGTVNAVMQRVRYFIDETVWEGATSPGLLAFTQYFTSRDDPEDFADIAARGRGAKGIIDTDFETALRAIGA